MIKHLVLLPLLSAALLVPLSGCDTYPRHGDVESRDRGHDRDHDRARDRDHDRDRYRPEVRVVFSDRDIAFIRDYYAPRHPHGYPPGLAKKGKVPPGHAMKLRRGEPLPRDLDWRALPRDLDERLSRLPEGYVRVVVGADIGIMNVRTRVVLDLVEDIAD